MNTTTATEPRGIFVTGSPGFITSCLLRRLAVDHPNATFYLLVEKRCTLLAQAQCERLQAIVPQWNGRWKIVPGDIRQPDLGMSAEVTSELRERIDHVWHLAAIYDLATAQQRAYETNVQGTQEVLRWCQSLPHLGRLFYISTCYVAGDRRGRIYEHELKSNQGFKNHYESTKYHAECAVQRLWGELPITIFRPSIVVGDSKTGEAAKADGPYFVLRWLLTLPRWLPLPHVGRGQALINVVPVDFVVDAMARLAAMDETRGRVFHLADPSPLSSRELTTLSAELAGRPPLLGSVPMPAASWLLRWPGVTRALGLPREALDYLDHEAQFDVSNTAAALHDRCLCPRVRDYWPAIVHYAQHHRRELFAARAA